MPVRFPLSRVALAVFSVAVLVVAVPKAALRAQEQPTPAPAVVVVAEDAAAAAALAARIRDEGMNRSQVMQTLSYLTDVIGPRLTASPDMKRANEWTKQKLTEWGLRNAALEAWGPFGRGWTLRRFAAEVVVPQAIPLIAVPKAWSPSTRGVVTGRWCTSRRGTRRNWSATGAG
jgi:hypothetical protein